MKPLVIALSGMEGATGKEGNLAMYDVKLFTIVIKKSPHTMNIC
jgi:hypothetical protein